MFDRIAWYALIALLATIPLSLMIGLSYAWVVHVLRTARRAFAPVFTPDYTKAATPADFAHEAPAVRTRAAIRELRSAEMALEAAEGALVTVRPFFRARSVREVWNKVGMGAAQREGLLLDASGAMSAALVSLRAAAARVPEASVATDGLDQPLVDALDRIRGKSPILWLVLHAGPAPLRQGIARIVSFGEIGRALAAIEVALPAARAAHAELVARYGSDADARAQAFASATPEIRRRRALRDLATAQSRLMAADGALAAAQRINVRLVLFGHGKERHDDLILSASTDLLIATQALEVAAARTSALAVDPAPLAVDLDDRLATSLVGRVASMVLPHAVLGLITTVSTYGRLGAARAALTEVMGRVAETASRPEDLEVAAAA